MTPRPRPGRHSRIAGFVARRRPELGGAVLLAGIVVFLVCYRLGASAYPNFDPSFDAMSRLGDDRSPAKLLWDVGLTALAAAWCLAAIAVVWPRRSRALDLLNVAPAFGLAVSLLVPLDANLGLHEVAAFSAFLSGILAVLANARYLRSPLREASFGLGGAALVGLSPASAGIIGVVGWGGLERLVVLPLLTALVGFALAALVGAFRAPGTVRTSRLRLGALVLGVLLVAAAGVGSGLSQTGYRDVFGAGSATTR